MGAKALSHGERVDRDGAFTSRRRPGEGSLNASNFQKYEVWAIQLTKVFEQK